MGQPEKRFKVGNCTASVFTNQVQTRNGAAQIKSVNLQRTYMDQNGQFQNTGSFGPNDIPKAMLALEKAWEYLVLQEKGE